MISLWRSALLERLKIVPEAWGAIMDIGGWLRSLGLERYEAAFRENEIDQTVLSSLTAEDQKDLCVGIVGHRRNLLDAITALRSDATAKDPSGNAVSSPLSATCEDRAERRQVTVIFSDLVGSTVLSTRMDPADLREVISAYQKSVAETVGRFGGFVAKYMGDGVLVYFGYPQAHEDDAEQAVRAGLDLVAAVTSLKTHTALQTRIGIATGLVVVGDLIGSGASQEGSNRWRDAKPCGTPAGRCRAEQRRHCRKHASARRQLVRACRPRAKGTQGDLGPCDSLGCAA